MKRNAQRVQNVRRIAQAVLHESHKAYTYEEHSAAYRRVTIAAILCRRIGDRVMMRTLALRRWFHGECLECMLIDAEMLAAVR